METETGVGAGRIVSVALAELVEFAALWAVTVTKLVGTPDGAVYKPVEEIVPTDELPPRMPPANQFTAVFVVPETVAVNCCDRPTWTFALVGEMETETVAAGTMVTLAFA
jgi:hypothetical protein